MSNKQNSEENSEEGDFEKIESTTEKFDNTVDDNILEDLSEIAEFGIKFKFKRFFKQ